MDTTNVRTDWWQDDVETPHVAAFAALTNLRSIQSQRIYAGLLYEATYEQRNVFSSQWATPGGPWPTVKTGMGFNAGGEVNLLTFNKLQIAVDTLVSKLSQADSQVRFLTDGGNWADRKKAEQIEKLVRGEFYRLKFYEIANQVRLDMLIFGRGYLKVTYDLDTKRPTMERIHPLDCFYDELEARDNPPRQMYQVKLVSKASLKALYPDWAEQIDAAQIQGDQFVYTSRGLNPTDCCELLEAWYLPSYPGADDGRHLLCIPTATLTEDERPTGWTSEDFPFAVIDWTRRRRGPYPIGLAEQTIFMQRNLDMLIKKKHECIYKLAVPRLLLDESSNVPVSDFQTNGVGDMLVGNFSGVMEPKVINPSVVPQDMLQAEMQLRADIDAVAGIVGLESTGEKPEGLDSGASLDEYISHTSVRQERLLKENEWFTLRAAEKLLDCIRLIKAEFGSYVAFGHYKDSVEEIKWSEIELPPDKYVIQAAAANLLPTTPAGRKQDVINLAQAGILTPKQSIRALHSPDILAITDDITSSEQDLEWTVYEMTKPNGRYLPPEPHQDLLEGIKKMRNAYLHERRMNAPDEVLARLDRWITEAQAELDAQQQAIMMQQMQMQQQMAMNQSAGQGIAAGQAPMPPGVS